MSKVSWFRSLCCIALSLASCMSILTAPLPASAANTIYYVDAASGSDANNGTTTGTAWKTLSKVNGTTFQPGDQILFKAGGIWTGQLAPKGSGNSTAPIILNMYGTGNKPLIDGAGMTGQGVVYLSNQAYWEINNLEVTNDSSTAGDRRGVEITASNYGIVNHIYIRNMNIHNIKGIIGGDAPAKKTAGIYVTTADDSTVATRYNDLSIENNIIHDVDNQGIVTNNEISVSDYPGSTAWNNRRITNLAVRNNTVYNISKNAMIIRLADGGVVEYNVAHDTATGTTGNTYFSRSVQDTVFQYNEGYLNSSTDFDGSMYDADLQSPGTIWQYSYSHDNHHGLMWFCTSLSDTGVIVRYNISQNDKGQLVYLNYDVGSASIYNNVFYTKSGLSPTIIKENSSNTHTYSFKNNIIYNNSTTANYAFAASGSTRTIDSNIFYGQHPSTEPADANKLTSDPQFVSPGSGGTGRTTVDGYKLLAGSPAIGSGALIAGNGGLDYWGNSVSTSAASNRGAYNGPATVVAPPTTIQKETENLTVAASSGDTYSTFSDASCSEGLCTKYSSDAANDYISYTFNVPQPGTYNVRVAVKKYNDRGKFQLSWSGTNYGAVQDLYAAGAAVTELDLGNITFGGSGDKTLKFTVTGKNGSSSGYVLSFDYIKMVLQ